MTEVKHTPGPWEIVRHMGFGFEGAEEVDNTECQMGFAGPNGERVCWFGQSANYEATEGDEPSEANARLIAAAPDLLEAGNKVLNYATLDGILSDESRHADSVFAIRLGDLRELRSAIAKAEGRA